VLADTAAEVQSRQPGAAEHSIANRLLARIQQRQSDLQMIAPETCPKSEVQ
jgi:hypothetical protein